MRSVSKETPYDLESQLIRVSKAELLDKLNENQATHRKTFIDAMDAYWPVAEREIKAMLAGVRKGKKPQMPHLPVPQDHTRDYDRIIAMVSMSQGEYLELSEPEIAQFVMDDWAWKREFVTSTSNYLVMER